jgi:hypothetical protein
VVYEEKFGEGVKMFSCSFVDFFLRWDDGRRFSTQTEFSFAAEDTVGIATELLGLEANHTDNALQLKVTDSFQAAEANASFTLDLISLTRNLNLTKTPVIALKLRANAAKEKDVNLALFFESGRVDAYFQNQSQAVSVPNDGAWHIVLVDLSETGIEGMLHKLWISPFMGMESRTAGDTLDISFVGFYADRKTAEEKLNWHPIETDTTETSGETEENESVSPEIDPEKPVETEEEERTTADYGQTGGCRSALSCFTAGILTIFVTLPFLNKKRRNAI